MKFILMAQNGNAVSPVGPEGWTGWATWNVRLPQMQCPSDGFTVFREENVRTNNYVFCSRDSGRSVISAWNIRGVFGYRR